MASCHIIYSPFCRRVFLLKPLRFAASNITVTHISAGARSPRRRHQQQLILVRGSSSGSSFYMVVATVLVHHGGISINSSTQPHLNGVISRSLFTTAAAHPTPRHHFMVASTAICLAVFVFIHRAFGAHIDQMFGL